MYHVDPFEYVKSLQPGLMIYGVGGPTEADKSVIFLIREDKKYVNKISKYPMMQIRLGMFDQINEVNAILMMIRFDNNPDLTYDGWINFCDKSFQLEKLIEQQNLIFQFYDYEKLIRTQAIPNKLGPKLQDLKTRINQDWSMKDFDVVKKYIYGKYNPSELWQELQPTD